MPTVLAEPRGEVEKTQSELWHAKEPAYAMGQLGTSVDFGLSTEEAKFRRNQYGNNEIRSEAETLWYEVLGRQFFDVLIFILLIAAGVSLAVGELTDAITILAIVLLNGLLGFVQEWKAEKAIAALKQMLSPQCRVIRDGDEQQIDAVALVPGDVVLLSTGDRVPADLRLVETLSLKVDESALTGESLSVDKQSDAIDTNAPLAERPSMAWAGTAVTNGRALGITVATGSNTEFGRIAKLTQDIGPETTTLQRELSGLGKQLGI
ncbi:MAG: HAD-IC family P-type ATPase, partial [Lacipirellulaceae bacterium]